METSGLILDRKLINTRHSSWVNALNMVRNTVKDTIDVEPGFSRDALCVDTKYPEIGRISCTNEYILFCGDGENSQIVSSRKGIVMDDPLLGFNPLFRITGVFAYNHKNELVIAWTDNNVSPKVLNIDNLPFELDGDLGVTDANKFTLCELFPVVSQPLVSLTEVIGNGSLDSGVYYISTAYGFKDESATAWMHKENPIYINDGVSTVSFNEVDGCDAGTATNKGISCNVTALDTNYRYLYVAVISKINGIMSAFNYGRYYIDSVGTDITFVISSVKDKTPITLTEVLSNNTIYLKVKSLANHSNELLLANNTSIPILNYQPFANDIVVEWVKEKPISLNGFTSSYKDPITIYSNKTFRAGEVYGILLGLHLKQLGVYALYPLPGRLPISNELDPIVDPILLEIDSDLLKYQIEDTSTVNADGVSGKMSYWENRNEVYPDWFPADSNDLIFAGEKVRHHKFPTLSALSGYGLNMVEDTNVIGNNETSDIVTNATEQVLIDGELLYRFRYTTADAQTLGVFSENGTKYTALLNQSITSVLDILAHHIDPMYDSDTIEVTLTLYNKLGAVKSVLSGKPMTYVNPDYSLTSTRTITMIQDDYLVLNITSVSDFETGSPISTWTLTAVSVASTIAGTQMSRALGIKLSNIVIPDNIRQYVDGMEVFYYERTNDDMTILDQSIIDCEDKTDITVAQDKFRFHGFSSLSNQLNPNPRYLSLELEITPDTKNVVADIRPSGTGFYGLWNGIQPAIIPYAGTKTILINDITYIPANNNADYDNLSKEDCFMITTRDDIADSLSKFYLYNICAYKTDMYHGMFSKRVVSTGLYVKIDSTKEAQSDIKVYGGDTFISAYSYLTYYNSTTADQADYFDKFTRVAITMPYESSSNVGLRHEGTQLHEKYYPKTDITVLTKDIAPEPDVYAGAFYDLWQAGNSYLYNTDYNSINNITSPFIWNESDNYTEKFGKRIHRSLPLSTESTDLRWRVVPARNYYDMPLNKGDITKILVHGQAVFIGHQHTTYKAFVKDLLASLNSDAYLTKGDIFDRVPSEIVDSQEGVIGVQNQECMISTPHGVLILDKDQAKMYLLNDSIMQLNQADVYDYLKEHLRFNDEYFDYNILIADASTYIEYVNGAPLLWSDSKTGELLGLLDNIGIDKGVILGYELTDSTRFYVTARNKDFFPGYTVAQTATLLGLSQSEIGYYPSRLRVDIRTGKTGTITGLIIYFGIYGLEMVGGTEMGIGTFVECDNATDQAIAIKDAIDFNLVDMNLDVKYTTFIENNIINIIALQEGIEYDMVAGDLLGIEGSTISQNFVTYYDKSFTLTYNFDEKYWSSRHSYLPTDYIQLRKGTYVVDGSPLVSTNKTYNTRGGNPVVYTPYRGTLAAILANTNPINKSFIDLAFNFKDGQDNYILDVVKWISKAYLNNTLRKLTFDKIMVYNETQCTGYIVLTNVNGLQVGTLEYANDVWYCNTLRNALLSSAETIDFLDKEGELIEQYINDGEVTTLIADNTYVVSGVVEAANDYIVYMGRTMDYNGARFKANSNDLSFTTFGLAKIKNVKKWFDMSEISSKFVAVRLYTSNTQALDLKLLLVQPLIKKVI